MKEDSHKSRRSRLKGFLDDKDQDPDRPVSMDTRQCQLVLSLVNDVLSGKRMAATFMLDQNGNLAEAGTKKVVEPKI